MRLKVPFVLLFLLLAAPFVGQTTGGNEVRIALLEQAQKQQDAHMEYQDRLIDQTRGQLSEVRNELSQIRGFGLGIGSLLSIAQLTQILLGLRGKSKS